MLPGIPIPSAPPQKALHLSLIVLVLVTSSMSLRILIRTWPGPGDCEESGKSSGHRRTMPTQKRCSESSSRAPLHQDSLRAQPPACPESRPAEGLGHGSEVPGSSSGPEGGAAFPPRSPTAGLPLPSERFPQVGGPSSPSHGPVCPPGVPHQHGPPTSCSHHFRGSERHEEPSPGPGLQRLAAFFL